MPDEPHGANLRKGRISLPGVCYFITTNVERNCPLIPFPDGAALIIGSLRWLHENDRVRLAGYVVMDNHVHFMIVLQETFTLPSILDSFKTYTATRINRLLKRKGTFWQEGYWDHAIRDEADFWGHLKYIHNNPVRRGLVERPEDYGYSTAHPSHMGDIDWNALGCT
jgi:putative transposase